MAKENDDASKTSLVHNMLLSSLSQQGGEESRMMVAHIMAPSTTMQPSCIFYFNDLFMASADEYFHSILIGKNSNSINLYSCTSQQSSCSSTCAVGSYCIASCVVPSGE